MHTILLLSNKNGFILWFLSGINNILLLMIQNCLSIAQASSSFKHFDTCTFTYATPTFITEVLGLATQV